MTPRGMAGVRIPAGLAFADLRLRRTGGGVTFDEGVVRRVLEHNGLGAVPLTEGNLSELLAAWYRWHLGQGGARDAAMDSLVNEAEEEDRHAAN